jgi:hypothetical protein
MSDIDLLAIPRYTAIPRPPLNITYPAAALVAFPSSLHPITHEPTAANYCIHRRQHTRLFRCAPGVYSQGGASPSPSIAHGLILVQHHR